MRTVRTRPLAALGLLGATALVAGCGGGSDPAPAAAGASTPSASASADGPLTVVASTDVWGDIASTVGGDAVEVTSIISDPSQDPHSYEANARDQLAVSDAAVVVANGGGYDGFMDDLVAASETDASVIDAVEVSGREAPAGGELNEHVWYDMPTVAKVADEIAAKLGDADPDAAETFTANADAFTEELAGIEGAEASVADAAEGTGIAITEPLALWMTEASGLTNETPEEFAEAIEEGTDVSPTVLADTLALFTDGTVQALVYNEQTTSAETDAVLEAAKVNDVAVVPMTETLPEGKDFVTWMTDNVEALEAAVTP